MNQIICFGDSITYGEYDEVGGGWVDRLKKFGFDRTIKYGSENEISVSNLGISGESTRDALLRIEQELKIRIDKDMSLTVVLAYGANDSAWFDKKGQFAVSKDEFKSNLLSIISIIKKYNARVVLLNTLPVIESLNSTPNHRGKVRNNIYISEYNKVIEDVSQSTGSQLINLFDQFPITTESQNMFYKDGLHPSALGHDEIFKIVKKDLISLLKI